MTYKGKLALLLIICLTGLFFMCSTPGINEDGNGEHNDNGNGNDGEKATKWELWSSGKTRLRGVNIWQKKIDIEVDGTDYLGSGTVGPPYTQEDFNKLANMGANYVNISHPGIFNQDPPYLLNQNILNNLKTLIDKIGKADMFAVIAFRTGPGRSEYTFYWGEDTESDPNNGWFDKKFINDKVWTDQNIQDAWVEMWKETANQFKDNPYVVGYDLMVEPNSNEVQLSIDEPEEFYQQHKDSLYDWNQMFPKIITGIRTIDNETPINVGGMGYSAITWMPYIKTVSDSRIVYMVHQYAPFIYTHQTTNTNYTYPGNFDIDYDEEPDDFNKTWLENTLNIMSSFANDNNVIIGCNEYGVVRWIPNGDKFMDDQMDIFEKKGLNYALWYWASSWTPYNQDVTAFNFLFGPDPNNKQNLSTSALIEVIKKYWINNIDRPSNLKFD